MKRIFSAVLLLGAISLAGLSTSPGIARADPSTGICNELAMCSFVWCPGGRLPAPDVVWNMSVCHHWYGGTAGNPGTEGGIPVGFHILEGDPSPANPCGVSPICLPCL